MDDQKQNNDLNIKSSHTPTQQNKKQDLDKILNFAQNESQIIKELKINFKEIMEVFQNFVEITNEYSSKIEKIALSLLPNNNTPEGRLIQALQGTLLFNSDSLNELTKEIKTILQINEPKIKDEKEDSIMHDFSEKYSELYKNVSKTYSEYINKIKEYEKYLLEKQLKNNDGENSSFQEKNNKQKNDEKYVLENQNKYFDSIKKANILLDEVFVSFNKDRNEIRKNMHSNCETFMDKLIKCVDSQKVNYNIFFDVIKNYSNDNYIVTKTDNFLLEKKIYSLKSANNFIQNQKSFDLKLSLIAYYNNNNQNNPGEIPLKDVLKIYNIFKDKNIIINTNEMQKIEELKNKKIIEDFYMLLFTNPEKCTDVNKNLVINLFNEDKIYRLYFLSILNNYRASGKFEMTTKIMDYIGELFKYLTDFVLCINDFDSIRYISILSMTFYKIDNDKKYYLCEYIKDNPLFSKMEFWEEYLVNLINHDNINEENDNKLNKQLNKEEQMRLALSCFSNMLSAGKTMINFSLSKEFVKEFINKSAKKYSLNDEQETQIYIMLDFIKDGDVNKVNEKKDTNSVINSNSELNKDSNENNENANKESNIDLVINKKFNDDIKKTENGNKENKEFKENQKNENKENKINCENLSSTNSGLDEDAVAKKKRNDK